jgi:hypothetical protein
MTDATAVTGCPEHLALCCAARHDQQCRPPLLDAALPHAADARAHHGEDQLLDEVARARGEVTP